MKCNFQLFSVVSKVLMLSVCSLLSISWGVGQSYNTATGFRVGSDFGITVVQRIAKRSTLELIYEDGLFESNRNLDLLFKRHLPLISKSFNFYTGLGIGHASAFDHEIDITSQTVSIPAVLGAEVTLGRFNLAADFQPTLLLRKIDNQRIVRSSGVSLRYVLVKRKKKIKKAKKKVNGFFDNLRNNKSPK